MADHYYSKNPISVHDRHIIEETLRGRKFKFVTDAGVFSKQGIDFGSRLLIETMEMSEHARVLDVGCGYGPIGLSAATIAVYGFITLIDINERAVQLAEENAKLNGIVNAQPIQSDLFEQLGDERFTTILTNPPIRAGKEIVHRIFSESFERLEVGGQLWVVIQKKQGAPSAFVKLESIFNDVEEVCKDKGYRIFKATK